MDMLRKRREARCRTLATVKELVRFGSGGTMDTDAVTILDCMPFATDAFDGSDFHQQSQKMFLRALKAERPDLVISYFRTGTQIRFLQRLRGCGIGVVPQDSCLPLSNGYHSFTRVSAFYPVRNESCFEGC